MRSYKALGIIAIAVSWVLANTGWLTIGNEALVGTELVQVLNLLPPIALLLIFLASYRKLEKLLQVFSAVAMVTFAYISIASDLVSTTAAVQIYENLSGIQGAGAGDVSVATNTSTMPLISAGVALGSAALTLLAAFRPGERAVARRQEVQDNRALWDEQSE